MSLPSQSHNARRAPFIVLEGVDGSGKSTQAQWLAAWYGERGMPVLLTREPGGTALAERLRALLLDPDIACVPRAELLMMLAARAQHVAERILPALQEGQVVICDRFSLSSLAYQGYGRGLPLDEVRAVDAFATAGVQPDVTLILDVPLDVALARIGERRDRFEGEGQIFLQRVIDGYRALPAANPSVRLLDGSQSPEAVQAAIREAVRGILS